MENCSDEIFADVILGVIVTPFMAIPLLSVAAASSYITTIGENYLEAMVRVMRLSSDRELMNEELVIKRLKEEVSKLKK